jgi:hypothetical protein
VPVDISNKSPFGFVFQVNLGEQVGKQVSITKDRVDRMAEKPGLAANPADGFPITLPVSPNPSSSVEISKVEIRGMVARGCEDSCGITVL